MNLVKAMGGFGTAGMRVERPAEMKEAAERAFSYDKLVVVDGVTGADAPVPAPFV